jgi:hypothetical protein
MRALVFIITSLGLGFLASADGLPTKPLLSFNLTATNATFSRQVSSGLVLRVMRYDSKSADWEVEVYRRPNQNDNLLYQVADAHGPQPFDIMAWHHQSHFFPDERIVLVRDTKHTVRIRLIDSAICGGTGNERFTGGRVEIYWK